MLGLNPPGHLTLEQHEHGNLVLAHKALIVNLLEGGKVHLSDFAVLNLLALVTKEEASIGFV